MIDEKKYQELCGLVWSHNQQFHESSREDQVIMLSAWAYNLGQLTGKYQHPMDEVIRLIETGYGDALDKQRQDLDQRIAERTPPKSREVH